MTSSAGLGRGSRGAGAAPPGAGSATVEVQALPGEEIPSLNGLRALSIGAVLLDHMGDPRTRKWLDLGVGDYGRLGVIVFFIISGFLITSLLMVEHGRRGYV